MDIDQQHYGSTTDQRLVLHVRFEADLTMYMDVIGILCFLANH